MKTSQFWYPLPQRLIAQHPAERRGTEKMLVLHRDTNVIEHRHIGDFIDYITDNDLLVVNDTKVFPARLVGTWSDTPGEVEVLMVSAAPMAGGEMPTASADDRQRAEMSRRTGGGVWSEPRAQGETSQAAHGHRDVARGVFVREAAQGPA